MIIENHLPQAAEPLVVDAATRGRRGLCPSIGLLIPTHAHVFPWK